MLVLFGIINFGIAFNQKIQLTAAAREGARTMAIKKVESQARTSVRNAAPGFNPAISDGEIAFSYTGGSSCPPDTTVRVAVSRNFTFQYILGSSTISLSGIGVMRCGG